ncbi:transglutaminase family protein [Tuwongella immobilis]|uniref:Transglutaminase-like domain-containing protein n=1 Tax=Tuwongella immobilis TaxID=692036 RepID=A0A6C2YPG0_9BACT|nr:transglutaminase family protein [Tuwongella immobilis]VIP03518.1 Uncharacterized protein OS=Azospirillum lipoferum (strain 4B) GN=AZOLI_1143 PE=4 SV=1: Bact_transglu_N: Transglut_core: DUF2126 [Tuwongella immobilis]VTS04404.1 Uncharacterized protein OS=Azospirillum lipoferum (strain 4B) GN=AZOLI_1143 PE=4 SV=1: Bact_transglu_N: Transglut_core: DUF2126 [Tuwongella immobilis]
MPIRVAIHHKTTYHYDRLVALSPQVIRLRPAPHTRTPIVSYSLKLQPNGHFLNWQQDPYANYLARAVFPNKTRIFSVEVDVVADMVAYNPFDFFLDDYAENFPFQYEESLARELAPYLETAPLSPRFEKRLAEINRSPRRTVIFLSDLNAALQREIRYLIRMEPGVQTCEETLEKMSGSCRDSAWLLVQLLRHSGLAARFVSGYLVQLVADQKSLDGPSGPANDFTDLHAWAEVYLPGAGWVGLDPTSGLFAAEGHIPLAATPEPSSAAPISGGVDESEVEFTFEMKVTRIHEDPRVTKPYTDEQWNQITDLGHQVDRDLNAMDVRLTMGGEPTFVSIDDMDGAEWNSAAMGPHKRKLSRTLLDRLRDRFGPGGLIHIGQGKWYPGESLPRWTMAVYWRRDGKPLWFDDSLFADDAKDYGFGYAEAQLFARTLAKRLGVDPDFARPAYEDPVYFLQKEGRLPVNVDPTDSKLDDAEERERLRRVFQRGLDNPVGFVLPLQRGTGKSGPEWQSGLWMLRTRHLILIPGDSPIGLRLPLPSLPWVSPAEYPYQYEQDPSVVRPDLPDPARQRHLTPAQPIESADRLELRRMEEERLLELGKSAPWVIRTALTVDPREGRMHIFLPPIQVLEDALDLITAIEDTASALQMPVVIEGYPLPFDPRVQVLKVTPDPGVIEVNIHPSANWDELVQNTEGLYEEARLSRLGTEKFMLDGRHSGTGGGNHMILGAATPLESPFLRRPDLLKSMINYWLNHPSLSYLFSGLFVGPTSQAPRIDETRADSLYELEIANGMVPEAYQGTIPPWLVDRIFRHLLVDVTGNTHRAEFCIDKLYSPDSVTGRLGLVEFRGFEMPPHARMSLTQQLLLRTLVARFWKTPYREKPIRWGTQLHDRFLLPFFAHQDFVTVLRELAEAGYPIHPDWFAPHFEFRFPVIGRANVDGIELELRTAIEPWYVLGEEGASSGTVRYVDSSVERLQIRVNGLVGNRYVIACNGRRIPLTSTGTHGEFVAGVRYRAWQPPSCLHPTIPVHAPLVFDVIDVHAQRAIGGCTYSVSHPGGMNYEKFPVNSLEAESRRINRFHAYGHTPGPCRVPPVDRNSEYPLTLDLRRPIETWS